MPEPLRTKLRPISVVRLLGCAATFVVALVAPDARAGDSAAAQALFEQGVRELEAGRFASACPALAESHRLDPQAGTLFALAECEAKAQKLASAFGHYQDYLGLLSRMSGEKLERHAERAVTARAQVEALKPQVPTLALVLPPAAPHGLVVERDGVTLHAPALGIPLPIDPGEHVVVTRVPGGGEERVVVVIAPGEAKRLELDVPPPAPSRTAPPVTAETQNAGEPERSRALRTWAFTLGGAGLGGVVIGSLAGIVVLTEKAKVDDHCEGLACDREGVAAADRAHVLSDVSTLAFGIGLTSVAASVVLFSLASESGSKRARAVGSPLLLAQPRGGYAGWQGRF